MRPYQGAAALTGRAIAPLGVGRSFVFWTALFACDAHAKTAIEGLSLHFEDFVCLDVEAADGYADIRAGERLGGLAVLEEAGANQTAGLGDKLKGDWPEARAQAGRCRLARNSYLICLQRRWLQT